MELASIPSADLVPGAIAAGLGLSTSGSGLITDVLSYLRAKRLLLVLDNFEQVTAAAPSVAELLGAAAGLKILVTSRSVLRITGEHEFPVPPLAVPPIGLAWEAGSLQRYASVRLFVDRARAALPGFELSAGNARAVAEICRRLDGLPLAIELAAARIRLLAPATLLARLDDRLSVLTGGARDLPERQRTMKNTLDWSHGLLSAPEQPCSRVWGCSPGHSACPPSRPSAVTRPQRAGPGPLSTRWNPWSTAAWYAWRPATTSRGSGYWTPSGSTPWVDCGRAAAGRRPTTGTLPISWRWPSRPNPSCEVPGSWRG